MKQDQVIQMSLILNMVSILLSKYLHDGSSMKYFTFLLHDGSSMKYFTFLKKYYTCRNAT